MKFVSSGQFLVFWQCFYAGVISGIFYLVLSLVRIVIKNKIVGFLCDLAYFLCVCACYYWVVLRYKLPSLSPYMVVSCLLGVCFIVNILQNTLAKVFGIVYNTYISKFISRIFRWFYDRAKWS